MMPEQMFIFPIISKGQKEGRPRVKYTSIEEMLDAIRNDDEAASDS